MPLDWLGQLKPSMKQQIALQRALLALQREDDEIRAKTMPQPTQPALSRGLTGGSSPSSGKNIFDNKKAMEIYESHSFTGTPSTGHFRPGAGSLEEALRAAEPATGSGLDIQGRAWARREEMAGERVVGAKDAYDHIITLDPEGQKVALEAVRKYKPAVYKAMETEGYISPAGVLAEPKKKVAFKTTRITGGWEYEDITYEDGTTETRTLGPAPEVEAEGATISESIALEKLGMEMGEYAERHRTAAIKVMGDMPRPGIDTVNIEGKDVPATVEHANAWLEGVNALTAYLSAQAGEAPPEGEVSMGDVKSMYEGRPDLISAVQQRLGIPITGVWDEDTEFAFTTYGDVLLTEEPVVEGKPKFERQKQFWADWVKKWGKTFKGVTEAVKGLK